MSRANNNNNTARRIGDTRGLTPTVYTPAGEQTEEQKINAKLDAITARLDAQDLEIKAIKDKQAETEAEAEPTG